MSRHQIAFFRRMLLVLDVCLSAGAFWLALELHAAVVSWMNGAGWPVGLFDWGSGATDTGIQASRHRLLMLGLAPVWGIALWWTKTTDIRCSYMQMFARYLAAVTIGSAALLGVVAVSDSPFVAPTLITILAITQLVALCAGRYVLVETLAVARRHEQDAHRVVIVGTDEHAVSCADAFRRQSALNVTVLGHVSIAGEPHSVRALPPLAELRELEHLLDSQPVDEVVFAVRDRSPESLAGALEACANRGVDVLFTVPPALPQSAKMDVANLSGCRFPLLEFRRTPTDEPYLALKRAIDVLGSLTLLMVFAPVLLCVAVAIKLSSPGSILFKQERVGRNGRRFVMYKFRSMVADAEARRLHLMHLNEMSGPLFKIKNDPRITRVGSFIRKTSLDELPQLLNVLFGDMSLVGPRPPLPSEVTQYEPWQRRRLSVKPGLTGLWQVSGRNQVGFEELMRLDLNYIDQWSLWLDVKILFRTVPAVFMKTGA